MGFTICNLVTTIMAQVTFVQSVQSWSTTISYCINSNLYNGVSKKKGQTHDGFVLLWVILWRAVLWSQKWRLNHWSVESGLCGSYLCFEGADSGSTIKCLREGGVYRWPWYTIEPSQLTRCRTVIPLSTNSVATLKTNMCDINYSSESTT
jgi:hypothetical protein